MSSGTLLFGPPAVVADEEPKTAAPFSGSPWSALAGWVADGDPSSPPPPSALGVKPTVILTWFETAKFLPRVDELYNSFALMAVDTASVLRDLKAIAVATGHVSRPGYDPKPPEPRDDNGVLPWLKPEERAVVFARMRKAGFGSRVDEALEPDSGTKRSEKTK